MKIRTMLSASVLSIAGVMVAQAQEEPAEESGPDPVVLGIIKESTDLLASTDRFSFHSETNFDAVQRSGVTVEFGSTRRVLVDRPNRMRVETVKRDGSNNLIVLDGDDMWAWSRTHNVYATTKQVGDVDESIDFLVSVLRVKAPLGDLLSPDLYAILTDQLEEAVYVDLEVVAGVESHHLLLRKDYVDAQIWITAGDQPLIQRIVITYKEEEGQPQFRAQFLEWNLEPGDVESKLKFTPPEDAERVRFHISEPASEAGDAS